MTAKKPIKKTAKKTTGYDPKYILCHPSTWIAAVLALALFVTYGLSMYGFNHIEPKTRLESSELAVFEHLAKMYIKDMDFTINGDQPTFKQATGYGFSNEDGAFYITFDFAPYPTESPTTFSHDDLDFRHGIIYFQLDDERHTYGHAFSYHDDASYHPDGTFVRITEY